MKSRKFIMTITAALSAIAAASLAVNAQSSGQSEATDQQGTAVQQTTGNEMKTGSADENTLCARMIEGVSGRLDQYGKPDQTDAGTAVDATYLDSARMALEGARQLSARDLGACLTMVNAARNVLASGRFRASTAGVEAIDLRTWKIDPLYEDTRSARSLIDQTAYGTDGEAVGEVHDMLVKPDGTVAAMIVEGGGFLDIGDRHVRVEWSDVSFRQDDADGGVDVPLDPDNMTTWSLFGDADMAGPSDDEELVRMTSMFNDTVRFNNGGLFGYADDYLLKDGKIISVVIRPAVGYGVPAHTTYATPYHAYGYGFSPGYDFYLLPYDKEQVLSMQAFDRTKVSGYGQGSQAPEDQGG